MLQPPYGFVVEGGGFPHGQQHSLNSGPIGKKHIGHMGMYAQSPSRLELVEEKGLWFDHSPLENGEFFLLPSLPLKGVCLLSGQKKRCSHCEKQCGGSSESE